MYSSLVLLVTSATTFAVFAFLFSYEERHNNRIGSLFRSKLDSHTTHIHKRFNEIIVRFGSGWIRLVTHYFTHTLLKTILNLLERCEEHISRLIYRNTISAERVYKERNIQRKNVQNSTNTLAQIAEHKETVQLSEKEKQEKRDVHLEGKT